ncbi:MAG TPA: hypothetical protein VIK91_08685 [Nannocystis sp.]
MTRPLALLLALALAAPDARAQSPAPAADTSDDRPHETTPVAQEVTAPPPTPEPELVAPPNNVSQSAGLGTAVATTDPESRRARAELEGTALAGKDIEGVPERLPPLQRGGWWCVFGGFALASVGGVFAGLAEAEEDRATRLVSQIDPMTGGAPPYREVQSDYEAILARGRRDAVLAQSFIAAGAVVLVAGLSLFLADRVKRRPARVRAGLGGLQVRF